MVTFSILQLASELVKGNIVVDIQKMVKFTAIIQDASNIMVQNVPYNVTRRIHMITLESFFTVLNILPKAKTV